MQLQEIIIEATRQHDKNITLKELIDLFIDYRSPYLANSTITNLLTHKSYISKTPIYEKRISTITPLEIQNILDHCLLTHTTEYARRIRGLIQNAYRYGVRMLLVDSTLAIDNTVVQSKKRTAEEIQRASDKFLSKEELIDVLQQLRENGHAHLADMCEFQALTGLRYGEMVALRDKDYDPNNHTININGSLSFLRNKGEQPFTRGNTKNEYSNRIIDLCPRSVEIIEKFQTKSIAARLWNQTNKDNYLFINSKGQPIDLSFMNKQLRKIVIDKKMSTHIFRHTHISLLGEQNVPLKAIMQRVGHNDPQTTLAIYTHATNTMKEKVMDVLKNIKL